MTKQDRHLTTTQLSALLDGQLSPEEQAQSDAHLNTCEQCQQQLAGLRQTVTLLRAMPQPELPRSFMLPTDSIVAPLNMRSAQPSTRVTLPTPVRHGGRPSYIRSTATALSTLAAVLGIVFLLSGLFGTAIRGGSASTSTSGNSSTLPPKKSAPQITKPVVPGVSTPHVQASAIATPSPSPTATPVSSVRRASDKDHNTSQQNVFQPILTIFDLSIPGSRAMLGLILLLIGIVGLSLLTIQRARSYP